MGVHESHGGCALASWSVRDVLRGLHHSVDATQLSATSSVLGQRPMIPLGLIDVNSERLGGLTHACAASHSIIRNSALSLGHGCFRSTCPPTSTVVGSRALG